MKRGIYLFCRGVFVKGGSFLLLTGDSTAARIHLHPSVCFHLTCGFNTHLCKVNPSGNMEKAFDEGHY